MRELFDRGALPRRTEQAVATTQIEAKLFELRHFDPPPGWNGSPEDSVAPWDVAPQGHEANSVEDN